MKPGNGAPESPENSSIFAEHGTEIQLPDVHETPTVCRLSDEPGRLSSIARIDLIRDERREVSGGKECFIEWTAADEKGLVKKFSAHATRIDEDVTYTMKTEIVIHTYLPGTEQTSTPDSTKQRTITAHGIKGDVAGPVRNDYVTLTTVDESGSVHRQSLEVPVRLDLSEFERMDTETMIARIGSQFFATPG